MADPPTADELTSQRGNRDTLAAYFKLHPLEDIEAATLKALVGDNYQQRVSDCRRDFGMCLQNVPRTVQDGVGGVKRLAGAYRWYPHGKPLGRTADTVIAAGWSSKHGRPFEEPFSLKP